MEAVNQLARSFIWMLHQQDELRKAALKGDVNASQRQLPVFGIASVGSVVTVYSAAGNFESGFVSRKCPSSHERHSDPSLAASAL